MGDGSVGWGVKLELAGRVLENAGPYTNKKQAKENICGAGLELLKELEGKGEISQVKRKAGAAGDAKTGGAEEVAAENCIGLLLGESSIPKSADLETAKGRYCRVGVDIGLNTPGTVWRDHYDVLRRN